MERSQFHFEERIPGSGHPTLKEVKQLETSKGKIQMYESQIKSPPGKTRLLEIKG